MGNFCRKRTFTGGKMQERDIVTNTYWADNERFADIMNVGMFHGKKVLTADKLEEKDSNSAALAEQPNKKKGIQKRRDVFKKADFGTNFVLIGIENQSGLHRAMPVRIMGYEFLEYNKQLTEIKREHRRKNDLAEEDFIAGFSEEDRLNPVCTMVLYYGKESWEGPTKLSDILNYENLPQEVREMVSDYPIHVIDARRFKDSEKLKTDARLLFGILQREDDAEAVETYVQENEVAFQNVCEDTFDAIAILTNHKSIMGIKEQSQNKGGNYDMCEAFRQMEERGEKRGEKHGRELGENKLSQLITALLKNNLINEIRLVTSDKTAREQYYKQYGIQ